MATGFDDEERTQLAAVEAGAMPVAVYADWLEERGDPRAPGVRWLAEHDKRPVDDGGRWIWEPVHSSLAGLGPALQHELRQRSPEARGWFASFGEAIGEAALVVADVYLASGHDAFEFADLLTDYCRSMEEIGSRRRDDFARWLHLTGHRHATAMQWLRRAERHSESLGSDAGSWLCGQSDMALRGARRSVLPMTVFERLPGGRRRDVPFLDNRVRRLVHVYETAEQAIVAAMDAITTCRTEGVLDEP